jgi:hypothetical protein
MIAPSASLPLGQTKGKIYPPHAPYAGPCVPQYLVGCDSHALLDPLPVQERE